MANEKLIHTDTVRSIYGLIEVSKIDPVGFSLRFAPTGHRGAYVFDVGDGFQPEPAEEDFAQSFKMAGANLDYVCVNQDQQAIMDALKELCTGTSSHYVISKLKSIPK